MATSWTCIKTCIGWPNRLATLLASTCKSQCSKPISRPEYSVFLSLNMRWLGLGQTVKSLRWLVCKFDHDQRECKSSQVNASAHKAWSKGLTNSRLKLSTYIYLRVCLARALVTRLKTPFHQLEVFFCSFTNFCRKQTLFTFIISTKLLFLLTYYSCNILPQDQFK